MKTIKMSATDAKLKFGKVMIKVKRGTPVIIEKNNVPEIVWISIDDYEDFLELKDSKFQASIKKGYQEIREGKFGTLDNLYSIHRKTIAKKAVK